MNLTDIDDKTIRRSQEVFTEGDPMQALLSITREEERLFNDDMQAIGNNLETIDFIRATDSIEAMQDLITDLHSKGFAYIADDGVYFSISKYRESGKTYGQLSTINSDDSSVSRIDNDEYDKESAHDFALWKTAKPNEPSWDFTLNDTELNGRPGWHIECSAMSVSKLGRPFDIHTGGIDLIFPHHENEIAQSTAGQDDSIYAQYFVHSAHLYVNGKKMSKSLDNFHTLVDVTDKGFSPMAFRLVVLQSHYRTQSNFSWDILESAENRLNNWRSIADLVWQTSVRKDKVEQGGLIPSTQFKEQLLSALQDDLNTPEALALIDKTFDGLNPAEICKERLGSILGYIRDMLGIDLLAGRQDITKAQKELLARREESRENKDWQKSDTIRDELLSQGIAIRDTDSGQIWNRV